MILSKVLKKEFKECREYKLGFWQCPIFLFIIMGVVNITSMLGVYIVMRNYNIPELVVFSVSAVSIMVFGTGASIISGVKQITKADKTKSEFVSIVSHQLKAPLAGIRWSLDLLLDNKFGSLSVKQEEYLKDIQENNSRMVKIVNDLLDVSRIDNGKMLINMQQEVDLGKTIMETVKCLKFFARANNTDLEIAIGNSVKKVKTDPTRIRMVIQNFVDNSIKYIGHDRGLVKIELKNDGPNVYCSVSDNGMGISPKEQGKIFDKFFRGGDGSKNQTIGTGLGLYIAKAFIESSKGEIGFESKKGDGSTFWFSLPAIFVSPLH